VTGAYGLNPFAIRHLTSFFSILIPQMIPETCPRVRNVSAPSTDSPFEKETYVPVSIRSVKTPTNNFPTIFINPFFEF